MALVLHDGSSGEVPEWAGIEMLPEAGVAPAPPASPAASRVSLRGLRRWSAVLAALLVAGLVGANLQHWADARREQAARRAAVAVVVVDVALDWEDYHPITVTVSLRNTGTRAVTLLALSAAGGAVVPTPGRLPLALAPGKVTSVPLSFDTCAPSPSWKGALDAQVRTADGAERPVALDVVGHRDEVHFVELAVEDACIAQRVASGP